MGKETKRLSIYCVWIWISGWHSWVYHYIDFMLEYISQLYIWLPCATKKIPLPFLFYNLTPSPFLSTSFSNSLLSFSLIPLLIKPSLSLYFLHNVSLTLNNHLPLLLCVHCLDCLWYDGCYYKGSFKTIISDTIAIYFWYFCRERRKNGKWKKLWFGSTWNVTILSCYL